ncbi:MAG TPA: NTP transferase domain-containing protein, partial [Saprospiraceae bacterium]|nr:NTP transferase domain-containing protein [Saprospiraceae bacterium]
MNTTPHRKHAPLARPALGRFGRHEWALVGSTCGRIQALAQGVLDALHDRWTCAYVDADHADAASSGKQIRGAALEYSAEPQGQRLRWAGEPNAHHLRTLLNAADLILVNGNHHEAAAQVLVADPAKEASLRKRAAQLTDVQLILLPQEDAPLPAFVEELVPAAAALPRLCVDDAGGLAQFFQEKMRRRAAPLCGLVLAGGRSLRMGRDKGSIPWHGRPQWAHVADLLQPLCQEVMISCRPEQAADFAPYPTLPDTFAELGPYGALLSAFRRRPDAAWLVTACDLPLLDADT